MSLPLIYRKGYVKDTNKIEKDLINERVKFLRSIKFFKGRESENELNNILN